MTGTGIIGCPPAAGDIETRFVFGAFGRTAVNPRRFAGFRDSAHRAADAAVDEAEKGNRSEICKTRGLF